MKDFLKIVFSIILIMSLVGAACDESASDPEDKDDLTPPLGLFSITGNEEVELKWYCSNFASDFDGYKIYMIEGEYDIDGDATEEETAAWTEVYFMQLLPPQENIQSYTVTGLVNGTTYSFHVRAHNDDPDLSFPSNATSDTPRDDITNITLYDQNASTGNSCGFSFDPDNGFQFYSNSTYDDGFTDVMFESFNAGAGSRPGLVGINGCRIQDRGAVDISWDEEDQAPTDLSGYADTDKSLTCFKSHVYSIVKEYNGNTYYGKIYIHNLYGDAADNSDYADVWIAYQEDANNNEYSIGVADKEVNTSISLK